MGHPFAPRAFRTASAATLAVGVAAGIGGLVRVLPWLLDPAVTMRLALPFARGLAALACEAAILLGWPLGWALAAVKLVERGEARALAALGEGPWQTLRALLPQGALFAAALGLASFLGGREASEPGQVVTELIARGSDACLDRGASGPGTYAVPLAGVTWLCAPGAEPRLVGHGPGALAAATFSAREARVSGDLREIDLGEVHMAMGVAGGAASGTGRVPLDLAVHELRLHGLAPFAHASSIHPVLRALAIATSAATAAVLASLAVLGGALRGRLAAVLGAAAGPLVALGTLRFAELRAAGPFVALAPLLCLAAARAAAALLSRLPERVWTASK